MTNDPKQPNPLQPPAPPAAALPGGWTTVLLPLQTKLLDAALREAVAEETHLNELLRKKIQGRSAYQVAQTPSVN